MQIVHVGKEGFSKPLNDAQIEACISNGCGSMNVLLEHVCGSNLF